MEYKGQNGFINTEDNYLTITYSGLQAKTAGLPINKPRVIPLRAISGVGLKLPTRLFAGWVTLGLGGVTDPEPLASGAASDPNTLVFQHKNKHEAEALHAWLVTVIQQNKDQGVDSVAIHVEAPELGRLRARLMKAEQNAAAYAAARDEALAEGAALAGRMVATHNFGSRTVQIFEGGYVRLFMFSGKKAPYEKLIAIEASSDVQKKSGLGRGAAAALTGGVSLAGSNKRGDVWLSITTDQTTHVLRASPPTTLNLKASKALESAGRAVIITNTVVEAGQGQVGTVPISMADELRKLADLREQGLLTDQEFAEAKASLLKS